MTIELRWEFRDEGLLYRLVDGGVGTPVSQWPLLAAKLPETTRQGVALLLGLVEQESATELPDGVLVPHAQVAQLPNEALPLLGLPEPCPYQLTIHTPASLIREPNPRFQWSFYEGMRQVVGPRIEGCFVAVGSKRYVLSEPLYTIIQALDRFNRSMPKENDERLLAWGAIRNHLDEKVTVTGRLKDEQIYHATSFGVAPYVDEQEGVTFDPVLYGTTETRDQHKGEFSETAAEERVPLLSDEAAQEFVKRFRQRSSVLTAYSIPHGYVVLDPIVKEALHVVKRVQHAPEPVRRKFLENPRAAIREQLDPILESRYQMTTEKIEETLDRLYVDDATFGERVRAIGVWQPKSTPWIERASNSWLPEDVKTGTVPVEASRTEIIRFNASEVTIDVPRDALLNFQAAVARAWETDAPTLHWAGQTYAVDRQTLRQLAEQLQEHGLSIALPDSREPDFVPSGHTGSDKWVLQIYDNLEQLEFEKRKRQRRPTIPLDPQSLLKTRLKPHQRQGIEWLMRHWEVGSSGALLADDMGLGKTLQALTFLAWAQRQLEHAGMPKPLLIVAPTGLLKNWIDEHDKHLDPGLGTKRLKAYGAGLRELRTATTTRRGQELAIGEPTLNTDLLQSAEWVLTTYETLRDYQHSFARVKWGVIIFDEAQKIKTPDTLVTNAAKAMEGEFTLVMTGTPIENTLADLWCILDTAQPGLLGDCKTFCAHYERKDGWEKRQELRRILDETEPQPPTHPKPMLRRIKETQLEGLPEKQVIICREPMDGEQLQRYNEWLQRAANTEKKTPGYMLEVIHQLRRISLHPWNGFTGASDGDWIRASARWRSCFAILDRIAERDEKALVFLESLELQPVLQSLIQRRYRLDHPPLIINGAVSGDTRKARVDQFQERKRFDVMILSPKAGGVGLTLTAANHVIHLSRWWNPSVEDQCTDRVYRIGQTRPVYVYYPMATHPHYPGQSFDERLHALLEQKRQLSRELLMPPVPGVQEAAAQLFTEAVEQVLALKNK